MPGTKSALNECLLKTAILHCGGKKDITLGKIRGWLGTEGKKYFHLQSTVH